MIPTEPHLVAALASGIIRLGGGEAFQIPEATDYYILDSGKAFSFLKGRVRQIIGSRCGYGYRRIQCGGEGPRFYVHQLVARLFLESPEPGQTQVRHLDGNLDNNSYTNLAYGTPQENANARRRTVGWPPDREMVKRNCHGQTWMRSVVGWRMGKDKEP